MNIIKKDELTLTKEFKKMDEKFYGKDDFLGKDLLTMPNKISGSRIIMFNSHLEQAVVLAHPEFPKVFTGYENEVGKYASSVYKTSDKLKIVSKIKKFPWLKESPYILIVKNSKKEYDVIERKQAEHLTEKYGYVYRNEEIDKYEKGDIIEPETTLYKSTSFDDNGNYCYGVNAKTVYLIDNRTIEDAFVISESLADRLKSYYVSEIEINVNTNDLLCNIYEDTNHDYNDYKMFPDIGEHTKDHILVSRRRINSDYALFDLKNESLKNINFQTDAIYYADGKVIDLDIYCNHDIETLRPYVYNTQFLKYLECQNRFQEKVIRICEKILEKGGTLKPDLSYMYKRFKFPRENEKFKWVSQKEFDHIILYFKVIRENKIVRGSKLTGRFGNKGVVNAILPDNEMPVLDNGIRADIIFNTLSVVNRLGSGPLYEIELNYIANEVADKIKKCKSLKEKEELFFKFLKMIHDGYYKFIKNNYKNCEDKKKFFKEVEENGIYILQPPFFKNISFEQLGELYREFDVKPRKASMNGKPIMQPLIIGDQYIMRLKHDPFSKFSARSSAHIDIRNRPSKSLNYKKHTAPMSSTPIRINFTGPLQK